MTYVTKNITFHVICVKVSSDSLSLSLSLCLSDDRDHDHDHDHEAEAADNLLHCCPCHLTVL